VRAALPEPPSFYFRRQCWISCDPDETSLAAIVPLVGADRFFWASDFPHPDRPPEYVPAVTRLARARCPRKPERDPRRQRARRLRVVATGFTRR
jgi:hypothetical protein